MNKLLFYCGFICCGFLGLLSCKSTQQPSAPASAITPAPAENNVPKSSGKVSHAYTSTGCGTVIIVPNPAGGEPFVLIPVNSLNEFDVDGLEIRFHYHRLKTKNPPGCMTGSPASILDIEKTPAGK